MLSLYKFEDLLLNTTAVLKSICQHCEIDYEETMLLVPQVGSSSQKDDPNKLGVDEKRVGAWHRGGLSNVEIEICEKIAKKEMDHFNYLLSRVKVSVFSKIWYLLLLPIKGVLALMLNWGRTKGIISFIKNRILK